MTDAQPGPGAAGPGRGYASADASADDEVVEAEVVTDTELSVEDLVVQLETVTAERDELADQLLRSRADFDNLRKRALRDQGEAGQLAVGRFAESLLPVLDACDAAVSQGVDGAEPIAKALLAALEQQGLTTVGVSGEPFDPTWHEAVAHEPGSDAAFDGPVVAEVLRTGYRWSDRVLRPAMVRVRG